MERGFLEEVASEMSLVSRDRAQLVEGTCVTKA
jgi:hypothetical protein